MSKPQLITGNVNAEYASAGRLDCREMQPRATGNIQAPTTARTEELRESRPARRCRGQVAVADKHSVVPLGIAVVPGGRHGPLCISGSTLANLDGRVLPGPPQVLMSQLPGWRIVGAGQKRMQRHLPVVTTIPGVQIDTHPDVLATLPPKYQPLFDRFLETAVADDRIRAVWLSGSLARGVSDLGSDLDLIIAIRDEDFAEFGERWRDWLADITPTLIARPFGAEFTGFTSTTPRFCRLDVVAERTGDVSGSTHRRRLLVFDRDGLNAQVPAPDDSARPDRSAIERLAEEFLRVASLSPVVVVARQDLLCAIEGVHLNQTLLYDLFVETNQPLPPMGAKQYSAKLTPAQRQVFLSLPPLVATRESVTTAMLATFQAFRTAGRAAAENAGASWPEALEQAVADHLAQEIPEFAAE